MIKTVVIFGGSGFIGGYIVRRLSKLGYRIIIPTSSFTKANKLKIMGDVGQILPISFSSTKYVNVIKIINGADYVINLKTIWEEQNNKTYLNNIYNLNKSIVDSIIELKIKKYVYFSGIGTNVKDSSKRTVSILNSEKYIEKFLCNYSIIKPSIVIGDESKFIKKLLNIFRFSFFIPIFGKGDAKFQPTFVDDIALAVEKIILKKNIYKEVYELGGKKIFSYKEFYKFIIKEIGKKRIIVSIPFIIAKFFVFFMEKLHIDLLNREQLELFKNDNLVGKKSLTFNDLEINTVDVKQIVRKIINNN